MTKPDITVDVLTRVTTHKSMQLELDGATLRQLLIHAGIEIPPDAQFIFRTPGGGDWSNCDIEIEYQNPVYVRWQTETDG
jgi:hypothetical protein